MGAGMGGMRWVGNGRGRKGRYGRNGWEGRCSGLRRCEDGIVDDCELSVMIRCYLSVVVLQVCLVDRMCQGFYVVVSV